MTPAPRLAFGSLGAIGAGLALCGAMVGTAEAGGHGFIAVPPLEVELGQAVMGTADGGTVDATQVMIGLSWASLMPKDTPIDVSIGAMCIIYPDPEPGVASRMVEAAPPTGDVDGGWFIDVALRTAHGKHWRGWLGGRGELIDQGEVSALGAAARASVEVWAPAVGGTSGSGGGALMVGTVALSVWTEVGVREQPRGLSSFVAAGMGARIPFLIAGG